tara:strand:+ start:52 stop:273 length:222 start_codon:yes stop_codon:yes gene_type:complete
MIIELTGYIAIAFSLLAMAQKDMVKLRVFHLLSAILYIVYGMHLSAYPIVLGAITFLIIHIWHLYKLAFSNNG